MCLYLLIKEINSVWFRQMPRWNHELTMSYSSSDVIINDLYIKMSSLTI